MKGRKFRFVHHDYRGGRDVVIEDVTGLTSEEADAFNREMVTTMLRVWPHQKGCQCCGVDP